MNRRDFLLTAAGAALAPCLSRAETRFDRSPFTLGVASGDPTPTGITLWTRLALDPLAEDGSTGGMEPVALPVDWEFAADEGFARVLARGSETARPELAHSVHVTLEGLQPGRTYWYRFLTGGAVSPVGRTRTLPAAGTPLTGLKFATACCQHYKQGLFTAYDHMIADDVDFLVHLGDYIYETAWGEVRSHIRESEPESLADYRFRHALYKTDPSLQRAHASFPFFCVPDNHDALKDNDPARLARRQAASQAWYEHLPLSQPYRPGDPRLISRRTIDLGDLLRVLLLDTRQFRDDQDLCREQADPDYGFGIYRPACAAVTGPARSMLGAAQESWLADTLRASGARWNAVGSTVLFAPFALQHRSETFRYEASWDYYPANRARLLSVLQEVRNPVVLSGDLHSSWAIDVSAEPGGPAVASELLATSISSGWPPPLDQPIRDSLPDNPHVRFYDSSRRGYLLHRVAPEGWTAEVRALENVTQPEAGISTLASFRIADGRPGIELA